MMVTAANAPLPVGAMITVPSMTDTAGHRHFDVRVRVVREATEQEYHDCVRETSDVPEDVLQVMWHRDRVTHTYFYEVEMD